MSAQVNRVVFGLNTAANSVSHVLLEFTTAGGAPGISPRPVVTVTSDTTGQVWTSNQSFTAVNGEPTTGHQLHWVRLTTEGSPGPAPARRATEKVSHRLVDSFTVTVVCELNGRMVTIQTFGATFPYSP